ncbi:MAG: pyrroloquinoline quinone biosynthesis protein PqqB [Alphaproteobacteria bacterium]|nr:pyrroloquinoline quinone biosynthesis protein PqqB [Alphaproteobacteria bacterium]
MRLIILGSGAGGGIPQWNANNVLSRRARAGDPAVPQRNQTSFAVSTDGAAWLLVNAAPELRQQIIASRALWPMGDAKRTSPIKAVALTGADVDQVAGLLTLREREPFALYATARVHEALRANAIFNVLADGVVARHTVTLGTPCEMLPGLTVEAFAIPGKIALYREDLSRADFGSADEDTVALAIRETATGRSVVFAPTCARIPPDLIARAADADLLLFDGTFYTDDEMIAAGEGVKTAARMGHVAIADPQGPLAAFGRKTKPIRRFIHINNTNPIAAADSPERQAIENAGWGLAQDGEEYRL